MTMRHLKRLRRYVKIHLQKNSEYYPKFGYQKVNKKPLIVKPMYHKMNISLSNKCKNVKLTSQQSIEKIKRSLSSSKEEDIIKRERELKELKLVMKDKTLSYYQKLTILFKQYGKVLVTVHIVTSIVWLGAIYRFITMLV